MAAGMGWKSQGIVTGIGVLRLGRRNTGAALAQDDTD